MGHLGSLVVVLVLSGPQHVIGIAAMSKKVCFKCSIKIGHLPIMPVLRY